MDRPTSERLLIRIERCGHWFLEIINVHPVHWGDSPTPSGQAQEDNKLVEAVERIRRSIIFLSVRCSHLFSSADKNVTSESKMAAAADTPPYDIVTVIDMPAGSDSASEVQ